MINRSMKNQTLLIPYYIKYIKMLLKPFGDCLEFFEADTHVSNLRRCPQYCPIIFCIQTTNKILKKTDNFNNMTLI